MEQIKLSNQIALLGKLLKAELITQTEYEALLKRTLSDYGIKSIAF